MPQPREPLADDLLRVLETGPFHEALSLAIARRGLTYDRLHHHLAVRNHVVSAASIVHWARGRSQPERPESLLALTELERVLDLPTASLSRLIGPRRPRGRKSRAPVPIDDLWAARTIEAALHELGVTPGECHILSVHDHIEVDAGHVERLTRVTIVLEATRAGVENMFVLAQEDETGFERPDLMCLDGVTLGRTVYVAEGDIVVSELRFNVPLDAGERTVVEFQWLMPGERPETLQCFRRFGANIRQYVLQVSFDLAQPPSSIEMTHEPVNGDKQVTPTALGPGGTVSAIFLDQPSGTYGLAWEWR